MGTEYSKVPGKRVKCHIELNCGFSSEMFQIMYPNYSTTPNSKNKKKLHQLKLIIFSNLFRLI